MKIAHHLTILMSGLIAAGCAHHEKSEKFSHYELPSSPTYGAGTTTSSSSTGTAISTNYSAQNTQPYTSADSRSTTGFEGTSTSETRSEADRTVANQVQQSITRDSTLAAVAPSVQVNARNGMVTLTGSVNNEQEKARIEALARAASGVISVNNQIQIAGQPTSTRPDQSSRLYQESQGTAATTEPARTDISSTETTKTEQPSTTDVTSQSSVTTTNQSQSATELTPTSERPEAASRIYSTNQTDTANAALNFQVQGLSETDKALGQKILQEMKSDASLAAQASMIRISADNGKITLRGTVKSDDEKKRIEEAVQRVSGVSTVDNQLQVGNPSGTADTEQNK